MSSKLFKAVIFDIGGVVVKSPLIAIAAYEKENGIPHNYINCSITKRGPNGAWQRFERGELGLFAFYELFSKELSDTANNNIWYAEYCGQRNIAAPTLPERLQIDGRELFGRMMRESGIYNEDIVHAIEIIRDTGKWRVIALTNNYAKLESSILADAQTFFGGALPSDFSVESELEFLGWKEGPVPKRLREMFDDFCDSSTLGLRKPDPAFYELACQRNGLQPQECVFLDDLGINLKAARQLGMATIQVPIGGTRRAILELEQMLGIALLEVKRKGNRDSPTGKL